MHYFVCVGKSESASDKNLKPNKEQVVKMKIFRYLSGHMNQYNKMNRREVSHFVGWHEEIS